MTDHQKQAAAKAVLDSANRRQAKQPQPREWHEGWRGMLTIMFLGSIIGAIIAYGWLQSAGY